MEATINQVQEIVSVLTATNSNYSKTPSITEDGVMLIMTFLTKTENLKQ